MDLRKILARKRQHMESVEAQLRALRDDVSTLERALEIAQREEDNDPGLTTKATVAAETASATIDEASPAAASQKPTGRLISLIREIVRDLGEPFSTVDVREEIKRRDPELFQATHYSSISGTMRRMTGKELVAVEKGGPGKEATYRRVDNSQPRPEYRTDDRATVEGERELVESAR